MISAVNYNLTLFSEMSSHFYSNPSFYYSGLFNAFVNFNNEENTNFSRLLDILLLDKEGRVSVRNLDSNYVRGFIKDLF